MTMTGTWLEWAPGLTWGQYYCIFMMPLFGEGMQGLLRKRPHSDTSDKWGDGVVGFSRLRRCTVWRHAMSSTMPIRMRARLSPDQIPNAPQLRAKQSHAPSGRPITQ